SVGCATFSIKTDSCPAYPGPTPMAPASAAAASTASPGTAQVKVQYLGVGGFLVQRGDDVVLFGPVYSNPSLLEAMGDHQIRTNRALVDRLLPREATQAQAIVIGHSHYDHLLDTPYIANAHAKNATVYGSRTTASLIASSLPAARLVDVGPAAVMGQSVAINARMRLWPIRSEHADQFRVKVPLTGVNIPFHVWRGEVAEPLSALPSNASEWAEGEVFSYLLDFLDDQGRVEFRVYYQDSGTDAPVGFPWGGKEPPDGKRVDVSLICLGGDFEHLHDHPEGIIKATRPRFLLLGHWENFFVPQDDICRTSKVAAIPLQDTHYFIRRAKAAMKSAKLDGKPIVPCPTASVFNFPIDPAGDAAVHKALKKPGATYECGR
ncbi:MAG TPA: MBL fold metallo-hydrolase, partial [Vicinamibacterales bacterium]|nr:MBL fold metallo-hydrolase [Vicinamibacterales bacterium]